MAIRSTRFAAVTCLLLAVALIGGCASAGDDDDDGLPAQGEPCADGACAAPLVCVTTGDDVDGTCGVAAADGETCLEGDPDSNTLRRPCAPGLECNEYLTDFPVESWGCQPSSDLGGSCADYSASGAQDGCTDPLVCVFSGALQSNVCAAPGDE